MRALTAFVIFLFSFAAYATVAIPGADPVSYDPATGEPIFVLEDLAVPQIYQGTKSVSGEFPAMGWIGNCTATAVAPNVVFTASHCVTTGKRISFAHRQSGRSFPATCTRHPQYNDRTVFNDYAFCKLDSALPADAVLASFAADNLDVGAKLLMEGYGAPHVGVHYWGNSSVRRYDGQDIVSCGPSTLGGGDSGGALLTWTDDRSGRSGFEIVGVNSRGNNSCDWYNDVTHANAVSFFRQYERDKGVQLCGVSANCGGTGPEPIDCEDLITDLKGCIGVGSPACYATYDSFRACLARPPESAQE